MNRPAPNAVSLPRFRACDLCVHRVAATSGHCGAEIVSKGAGAPLVPITVARAPQGPCGPDAFLLDMPSWR